MNPPSANPSSSAPLSKPRSLSIKGPILVVIWPPGTGKISVSVSLLAAIVTKPKYVLMFYPVMDLSFKRSVKPRVLTLLDELDKAICMGILPLQSWKSWIYKTGTSIMIISTSNLSISRFIHLHCQFSRHYIFAVTRSM